MVTRPPPTIIEPQRNPSPGRLRSRSQQWLDTLIHKASLPSSRHSRSAENVKDVIANLGLAAGTVVTGHIKPKRPSEEDVLEGLGVLLNGFLNITQRVKAGLGNVVETIEVGDDAQSVHSFHPITEAKWNPFEISTDENTDAADGPREPDQQAGSPSWGKRRMSEPLAASLVREESFGEFVMEIQFKKESGQGLPGSARLDTGMTRNAVSESIARMLGYPIEDYNGGFCIVADGREFHPIGQVTIPFKFVHFRTAKTWHVEFVIFPEGSPFDICLGRRFISLADLLRPNPEALPVEFRKLTPSEAREKEYRTHQADRDTVYTKDKEDRRYGDRRKAKPKDKEPRKW